MPRFVQRLAGSAGAALAILALLAGSPGPSPSPSPTPTPTPTEAPALTPDQILIAAQQATRRHGFPAYVTYQMHEIFDHHGAREVDDYRVWYRSDGQGLMQNVSKDHFGRAETYFGRPFPIEPVANIILYATPAPLPAPLLSSPAPVPSGHTAPPVLFTQPVVGDRYYAVQLAGLEIYEGHAVYHLALTPLTRDETRQFRDLWVDVATYEVWKAHVAGSGSKGAMTGSIDATSEFEPVGDYWVIRHMVADGEGHIGIRLLGDSAHYEYTFSDFGFPPSVPDWYFDSKKFRHH